MKKGKSHSIKWAIMKSDIALYAVRLVETLDDAEGLYSRFVLEQNPSRMPVLINTAGGYMSYDQDDPRIVEIKVLPCDEEPLTLEEMYPKDSPLFRHGWISPEGHTYWCSRDSFIQCASAIVRHLHPGCYISMATKELYDTGWAEVLDDPDMVIGVWSEKPLTRQQITTLTTLGFDKLSPQVAHRIERAEQAYERGEQ